MFCGRKISTSPGSVWPCPPVPSGRPAPAGTRGSYTAAPPAAGAGRRIPAPGFSDPRRNMRAASLDWRRYCSRLFPLLSSARLVHKLPAIRPSPWAAHGDGIPPR